MKIVAAGGGSGGHVTPVLAVINELKKHDDNLQACFVTDKKFGSQAQGIMQKASVEVRVKKIHAGKFRRYHRTHILKQLFDIPTNLKNLRDIFVTFIGFLQSFILLVRFKPDVVFTKGGFVCVPLGMAAHLLRIPIVIHDSDAHPGLANRIVAKWATTIATGAPLENYKYPKEKSHYVGLPVDTTFFRPINVTEQQRLKAALGLHDTKKPLIVVTGGGLGARNINRAVTAIAPQLLDKAAIVHVTGTANYREVLNNAHEHIDYLIKPFINGLAPLFGAADIVVTRAGATSIQELAAMAKASIIVPNPILTGGHQLKNAAVYEKVKAALVIDEDELVANPGVLRKALELLIEDSTKRQLLGKRLHVFAKPEAAVDMAALLVEAAVSSMSDAQKS
jgi:UDP-N-acetylglucosamine--N-acetylmuramyl-(pentapeptide) pyrophosphoryl-undecaprenol N-acetylglucosamine transferase